MIRPISTLTISAALLVASAPAVHALPKPGGTAIGESSLPASAVPAPLREVGYDQRLGERVPLDLPFRDESGRQVRLGDYFGRRPVILVLAYYDCPMLCDLVLQGVTSSLKPLTFDAGREFDVVVASIDPTETAAMAAEAKRQMISRYGRDGAAAGWHFLTGPQTSISTLTRAVGFRYAYDAQREEYAHPAGMVILTPKGRVSRYLFGLDFPPRDIRLALIESTDEKIGSLVDQIVLYCFHYNPAMGKYSAMTMNIVRAAAAATVVGLVLLIVLLKRRDSSHPGPVGAA